MKIMITGAGGQLGMEWTHFLKNTPHHSYPMGSDDLDITDAEAVDRSVAEIHPDLLVNCAAYTAVDAAEDNRETAFRINETGPSNLAKACRTNGVKLVHYSTDYIFEGSYSDQKLFPDGYPEDHQPNPQNTYGESKLAGEKAVEASCGDWLIIRVSWLCGRHGNNFVKTMLRLAEEKDQLKVVNDQVGSPSYCSDVVEKTMTLAELDQKGYFHISSEGKITWYQFTEEIFRMRNIDTPVVPVTSSEFEARARRPAMSYLNTKKIAQSGLKPVLWYEGLKQLLHQLK